MCAVLDSHFAERAQIAAVFTPSQPVARDDIFAGRAQQRFRLVNAIMEPGRHGIVYGSRGVGKTSLANIVSAEVAFRPGRPSSATFLTVNVRCTRDDDFDRLWQRAAQQVEVVPIPGMSSVIQLRDPRSERSGFDTAAQIADAQEFLTPPLVTEALRGARQLVLVFDEFDAVQDEATRVAFADLIKQLSDTPDSPTIVLVGVAADIDALIGNHESIQRCVEQIEMPPMDDEETLELVRKGFAAIAFLDIDDDAAHSIVWLSRGYPAFAHSIAKRAAEQSVNADRTTVTREDVFSGAFEAVSSTPYSLGEKLKLAADSRHPADETRITLAAAAYCLDHRFRPMDVLRVREAWGLSSNLQTVSNHLKKLSETERGSVMRSFGQSHPAYEFTDPMFVPYVVIRFLGDLPPGAPPTPGL